ncbi:hypothetical protein OIU77_029168 [Salix suchowensis]|uniref:Uncharacterized protein n=1 Tax=Salix suchowensis TaxID=1278906 RepID=A0ABQ9BKD4_9ROSI|nr:hypothetical protein OIU77_029168 [Salix suchowensis]
MKKVQVLGQGGCSRGPVLKFGGVSACHFGLCSPSWSIPCTGKMIMRCRESAALESLSRDTGNSKPAKIGSNSSGDRDNHLHVKFGETREEVWEKRCLWSQSQLQT